MSYPNRFAITRETRHRTLTGATDNAPRWRFAARCRRALGLTSEHYPKSMTAHGVLPDGRPVRLVKGSGTAGTRRGMGMHRIQILCDQCNRWIPMGRIAQHEGTGACYTARGRGRATRDPGKYSTRYSGRARKVPRHSSRNSEAWKDKWTRQAQEDDRKHLAWVRKKRRKAQAERVPSKTKKTASRRKNSFTPQTLREAEMVKKYGALRLKIQYMYLGKPGYVGVARFESIPYWLDAPPDSQGHSVYTSRPAAIRAAKQMFQGKNAWAIVPVTHPAESLPTGETGRDRDKKSKRFLARKGARRA